jgi:uncharacterized RDD family membrane protein YckC
VIVLLVVAPIPTERVVARLVVAALAVTAYEAIGTTMLGGTPGKRAAGLQVLELDARATSWRAAITRGAVIAVGELAAYAVPVVSAGTVAPQTAATSLLILGSAFLATILSTFGSPQRRGLPDRLAGTVVVDRSVLPPVRQVDLDLLLPPPRATLSTPWGPVAGLGDRWHARLSRLDDALLLLVGLFGLGVVTGLVGLSWSLALGGLWAAVFVVDETRRVARQGGTAGHRRAGLVVVDIGTGEPPAPRRAFARALVLGLCCYVPVVQFVGVPFLLLWIRLAPSGRGLHDLAGATVVVASPALRTSPSG